MATPGFAGKILRVNRDNQDHQLNRNVKNEAYGGGHGTAAAIFWDLCVAPGDWDLQDAFDPRNVVSLMTGPLAGTGLPLPAEQASPACRRSPGPSIGSATAILAAVSRRCLN